MDREEQITEKDLEEVERAENVILNSLLKEEIKPNCAIVALWNSFAFAYKNVKSCSFEDFELDVIEFLSLHKEKWDEDE